MATDYIPKNMHTVTPYLLVDDITELITFLEQTFNAKVEEEVKIPNGDVMHAQVRVGDSVIMMGKANDEFPPKQMMLYIYTKEVDKIYKKALDKGATSIQAPRDEFYGDRTAGVLGPMNNYWWIATHIEDVSSETIQKRMAKQAKKR